MPSIFSAVQGPASLCTASHYIHDLESLYPSNSNGHGVHGSVSSIKTGLAYGNGMGYSSATRQHVQPCGSIGLECSTVGKWERHEGNGMGPVEGQRERRKRERGKWKKGKGGINRQWWSRMCMLWQVQSRQIGVPSQGQTKHAIAAVWWGTWTEYARKNWLQHW